MNYGAMQNGSKHSITVIMSEMSILTPANTAGLHYHTGIPKRLLIAVKNANEPNMPGFEEFFIPFFGNDGSKT